MCVTNDACNNLLLARGDRLTEANPATCYQGFQLVRNNYFSCDIKSKPHMHLSLLIAEDVY